MPPTRGVKDPPLSLLTLRLGFLRMRLLEIARRPCSMQPTRSAVLYWVVVASHTLIARQP